MKKRMRGKKRVEENDNVELNEMEKKRREEEEGKRKGRRGRRREVG